MRTRRARATRTTGTPTSTARAARPPTRLGPLKGEQVAFDQIVDVDGMEVRASRADDRVAAARDRAEQLEQPRLARAVDGPRPDHADGQPPAAVEVEGERLCLRLRSLVDVARRQRRGLVGGRGLDMAIDAHGRGGGGA